MLLLATSSPRTELIPPQAALTDRDRELGEMIGIALTDQEMLFQTKIHHLGDIVLRSQNCPAARVHCGPEDTIKRGGTKFKVYEDYLSQTSDLIDHGVAMKYKIGAIGETDYDGGKASVGIPGRLDPEETKYAIKQFARLMFEGGLADPRIDGVAGDEGTNQYIGTVYPEAMAELGVSHPEALVTGKEDMKTRPPATGRGAIFSLHQFMHLNGEQEASVVIQGAGAAGASAAAQCNDPENKIQTTVDAIGEVDKNGRPVTLTTNDQRGLAAITHELVEAIPEEIVGVERLYYFADKLRDAGIETKIEYKDVLTYEPKPGRNTYLCPAATSNVIHEGNIDNIKISKIAEIGNHTITESLQGEMEKRGYLVLPGEIINAGGCAVSILENRRDLAKIKASEKNLPYVAPSDNEFNAQLYNTMTTTATRAHLLSNELKIDITNAMRALAMTNYALKYNINVRADVRDLVLAS